MSNRFTKYTADKLRSDGWLDKEQADHLRTQLKSVEAERDELKQLLAHKNETADTFMNQVKNLHKNLEGAQLADGTPFCFRCKAYHLKDQQCLMPR